MISPYLEKTHVVVNLDECVVEVVKNGWHYSLDEYLALRIEKLLDLRMQEAKDE